MAKVNGLNVRLYVEGYDLSGDANSLSSLGYSNELLDVTTLDVSAHKRIVGIVDGEIGVEAWFDNASSRQHAVWSSNSGKLPTADQDVLVPMGASVRMSSSRWARLWATLAWGWYRRRERITWPVPLALRLARRRPSRLTAPALSSGLC